MDKTKVNDEIKLCGCQLLQLLKELAAVKDEVNGTELNYGYYPARAAINNRIKAVRKDLLRLNKSLYNRL